MVAAMWLLVLQLVVHLGSTTRLQEVKPQVCYQCSTTSCAGTTVTSSPCPSDQLFCATIISTPNVTSWQTCSTKQDSPCTMTYTNGHLQLTCICQEHLCNTPFTKTIQDYFISFSQNVPNTTDLLTSFLNTTKFANFTADQLHAGITEVRNGTSLPVPQALKQETPLPSDDDEDEGEGSGSIDEPRTRLYPSAPADPSSYLPAENKASYPLSTLVAIPIYYLLTTA